MASKKYSDFTAVTTLADGDMLPLETAGGLTRRILWSSIKTLILAFTRPVGSYYVQYPNEASSTLTTAFPSTQSPATLFGGAWTLMYSTEGIVFQTEGYDGAGRTDGLMEDQMQGWQLGATADSSGAQNYWAFASGRDWSSSQSIGPASGSASFDMTRSASQGAPNMLKAVNDGTNGTPRTGTRTAHRNRLFRVYRRDA